MNAGRSLGYLALAVFVAASCLCCMLFGVAAGGLAGGAAGFVAGRGSTGLAGPRTRMMQRQSLPTLPRTGPLIPWSQITPQAPRPPVSPQVPRPQVTPQAPLPQRTPQPAVPQPTRPPQALRTPLPADATGALVQTVDLDSPAEKAGVQVGDLITGVDNAPVDATHPLTDLIRAHRPGDKVTLTVRRQGQVLRLPATLGTRKLDTGQEVTSLGISYVAYPATGPTD
jgi:membrane-associated protease RseP (regulator of RpoE activity)